MVPTRFILEIIAVVGLAAIFIYLVKMDFHENDTTSIQTEQPIEKQHVYESPRTDKQVIIDKEKEIERSEPLTSFSENVITPPPTDEINLNIDENEAKRVVVKKKVTPTRNLNANASIREKISQKLSSNNQVIATEASTLLENVDGKKTASWTLFFIDKDGQAIQGILIRTDQLSSVYDAAGKEDTHISDFDGHIKLKDLPTGRPIDIFHYDSDMGIKRLAKTTLKQNEEKEQTFILNLEEREPGALGFRLQDKDGIDIHEGWIAQETYTTLDGFVSAQSGTDFLGSLILPDGLTWVEQVPSKTPVTFYFGSMGNEPFFLGEFTLESEERRVIPIIRIDYDNPLKRDYTGIITNEAFEGIEGVIIKAVYQDGREIIAHSDNTGYFYLKDLDQKKAIQLFATKENDIMVLHENLMINESTIDGETFIWKIEKSLKIQVFGDEKPLPNTSVSIVNEAGEVSLKHTDNLGLVEFNNISSSGTYILRVSEKSSFFEPYVDTYFKPKVVQNEEQQAYEKEVVLLVSRPGVRVKVNGPTWYSDIKQELTSQTEGETDLSAINPNDYAMSLKAWVGISDGKNIIPDQLPGNEYSESIIDGELVFLTPPNQPFWIYIGGLSIPWGNALFGPFVYKANEIIQVQLNRVAPLSVRLLNDNVNNWNLLIYKHDPLRNLISQTKGSQMYGDLISGVYLGPDSYMLRAKSNQFKTLDKYVTLTGDETNLEIELEKKEESHLKGGYIASYLVSDRFDLLLNENTRFHHGEMCYGFNKDLLAHLEGEANFDAFEFRENKVSQSGNAELDQDIISWRTIDTRTNGALDLKTGLIKHDHSVRYMQAKVYSGYQRDITLGISSDDGVKGWVNGQLVHINHIARPVNWTTDSDFVDVTLREGWNIMTFKVDNSGGGWLFKMRLLDRISREPIIDLELKPSRGYTNVY